MQISHSTIYLDRAKLKPPQELLPTLNVTGFPISILSFNDQVSVIVQWAYHKLSRVVCVSNVHMLMEGHWRPEFAQVLREADLLTPDGMPLVWMTSLIGKKRRERVAGMELMLALCQQAEAVGIAVFLLGSTDERLAKVRHNLSRDFPRLHVAGAISPPFRPLSDDENESVVEEINVSKAGLVFVALGCPKQEQWMFQNRGQVRATMVGLGGVFSVYAGAQQWAPRWIRRFGLEWCYRLMQEPSRLWKRYASTIPPFLWLAFRQIIELKLGCWVSGLSIRKRYLWFSRALTKLFVR